MPIPTLQYLVTGKFFNRYEEHFEHFEVKFPSEDDARRFIRCSRANISDLSDEDQEWLEDTALAYIGIPKYNTGMIEPQSLYRCESVALENPR